MYQFYYLIILVIALGMHTDCPIPDCNQHCKILEEDLTQSLRDLHNPQRLLAM